MNADLLREAAKGIRWEADAGGFDPRPGLAHGVAGFLEAIAHRQESGSDLRWPHPEDVEWAEQIARAYLDGAS